MEDVKHQDVKDAAGVQTKEEGKNSLTSSGNDKKRKKPRTRKPRPAYGTDKAANPGDGERMEGGTKGSTGGMSSQEGSELDARNAYKQDPSWAQTNPTEYAAAFEPAFTNYDQVIKGARFPWNLSDWNGTTVIDGDMLSVSFESDSAACLPAQYMVFDVALTCGEVWYPDQYGAEYQPMVDIGRLLYQAISARKRAALPVDGISISAYLVAFQSIVALRSYIKLILKLCSITANSAKNVAKRARRMLRVFFTTSEAVDQAVGEISSSSTNDFWENAVQSMNAIDGLMNQCMSPPELPIYKRADYLFSHVIAEYNDDEMSKFYIMRLDTVYAINWVGDSNGTYLDPVYIRLATSLSDLIGKYRQLVNAFIGRSVGADDPNNIQAALKYVFANKIHFDEWQSIQYTTSEGKSTTAPVRADWADVLASGIDCHTWLHNMKIMPEQFLPLDISYDENFKGLRQHWYVSSIDNFKNAWVRQIPSAWDFEFGQPSADDMYEASTLHAMWIRDPDWHAPTDKNNVEDVVDKIRTLRSKYIYRDKGCYTDAESKANKKISDEIRNLRTGIGNPIKGSFGTEIVTNCSMYRVMPDLSLELVPYQQAASVTTHDNPTSVERNLEMISWAADFNHRPLQYLLTVYNLDSSYERKIIGVNYDTYGICPIRMNDIDRMHYVSIKSYFGINNRDTLSWITPSSNYSDLDKK